MRRKIEEWRATQYSTVHYNIVQRQLFINGLGIIRNGLLRHYFISEMGVRLHFEIYLNYSIWCCEPNQDKNHALFTICLVLFPFCFGSVGIRHVLSAKEDQNRLELVAIFALSIQFELFLLTKLISLYHCHLFLLKTWKILCTKKMLLLSFTNTHQNAPFVWRKSRFIFFFPTLILLVASSMLFYWMNSRLFFYKKNS